MNKRQREDGIGHSSGKGGEVGQNLSPNRKPGDSLAALLEQVSAM